MKNPKLVYEQNIKNITLFLNLLKKRLESAEQIFSNLSLSVRELLKVLEKSISVLEVWANETRRMSESAKEAMKSLRRITTKLFPPIIKKAEKAQAILEQEKDIFQKSKEKKFIEEQAYVLTFSYFEVFLKDYFKYIINKYNIFAKNFDSREYLVSNLSEYDFNIKDHMGDLMVEKFDFSKLNEAWKAYNKLGIDFYKSGVTEKKLNIILNKRCVLVHNLGLKDSNYFKRVELIKTSKTKQRISIKRVDVMEAINNLSKIVDYIDAKIHKKIQRIELQRKNNQQK